jgi:uncharacterized protein (TIGR02996 family)
MDEELALLRGIAWNPYDNGRRGAYADWLDDHGREVEATHIRSHALATRPAINSNSLTVGELIGVLYDFPIDTVVLYLMCSDWSELQRDDVCMITAEEQKIVYREQNGYSYYNRRWYPEGETPKFVTAVCFPGN